jgi:tetratricopeptide (TPR) repeat protein
MATFIFAPSRLFRADLRRLAATALLAALPAITPQVAHAGLFSSNKAQGAALLQQAYDAYQSGDYPGALRLIDQGEKLKPNQPDGWNLRGAVYLKQGQFAQAQAAFARAVAIDPNLWAAQFNLAEISFKQKNYRQSRTQFDALLAQTDHYKDHDRWELVQYKVFLSYLLMGDDAHAQRALAKLPSAGASTPACLYAQAALSFSRQDIAAAQRTLATAESTFSPALNEMFSSSLETAGWQAQPLALPPQLASALPASLSSPGQTQAPVRIDPRLEASVADPLPSSPGSGVYSKLHAEVPAPEVHPKTPQPELRTGAEKASATAKIPAQLTPPAPAKEQDHFGLLME